MQILINQKPIEVPELSDITNALYAYEARPPFAVALNGQFVPRSSYATTKLKEGDQLEIVQPVVGG